MKITSDGEVECKVCTQGKMTQSRSMTPDKRATAPFDLVHSDLAGPESHEMRARALLTSLQSECEQKCGTNDHYYKGGGLWACDSFVPG